MEPKMCVHFRDRHPLVTHMPLNRAHIFQICSQGQVSIWVLLYLLTSPSSHRTKDLFRSCRSKENAC